MGYCISFIQTIPSESLEKDNNELRKENIENNNSEESQSIQILIYSKTYFSNSNSNTPILNKLLKCKTKSQFNYKSTNIN